MGKRNWGEKKTGEETYFTADESWVGPTILGNNLALPTLVEDVFCLAVVVQLLSHVWHCNPTDCSLPGFPVLHHLSELAQTHVHWGSDAIQPSRPLLSPSPLAFNLSQHQGLS